MYPRITCPSELGTRTRPGRCGRTVAAIPLAEISGKGKVVDHKRRPGDLELCPGSGQHALLASPWTQEPIWEPAPPTQMTLADELL